MPESDCDVHQRSLAPTYEAALKYYDKTSDMAVLKIEDLGAFDFFNLIARNVQVGERVYAIGNPRGLEQSMSDGIVSGLRNEDGRLWIQHSAPISPGSSEGALISSRGELLGINSWYGEGSQNLNFAVPASTLATAYTGARAMRGLLRFPGLPPVSKADVPPAPLSASSRPSESGGTGPQWPPSDGRPQSSLQMKSDPMGVDFRPYMIQVLAAIRRNWFAVYPEEAKTGMRGQVIVQFRIDTKGLITKVDFNERSTLNPLDEAAVAAISASMPMPPFPAPFKGDHVDLQMSFLYNMPR